MSLSWVEESNDRLIITDSGCGCCSHYESVNVWSLDSSDSDSSVASIFDAINLQEDTIKELQDTLTKMKIIATKLAKDDNTNG